VIVSGNLDIYLRDKSKDQYADGMNCPFGNINHVQIHPSNTVMQAVNGKDYEILTN
jgi:hypothetical protein